MSADRFRKCGRIATGVLVLAAGHLALGAANAPPGSCAFRFNYAATITGAAAGDQVRVWIPVATASDAQQVAIESRSLPTQAREGRALPYGDTVLYFEAAPDEDGAIPLSVSYLITRYEVRGLNQPLARTPAEDARFRQADSKVPAGGKPMELLAGMALPSEELALARCLYDVVDDRLQYRKDKPGWGRGDSAWACDSGFGNCTDFHSLFISLARGCSIPAKFQIGFLIPAGRSGGIGGYHCWAFFHPKDRGWIPVDISEANQHPEKRDYYFGNLSPDRVAFTTGRDIELVPRQDGPPLNFFIYPYVEVAGKPWPAERIKLRFSFENVDQRGVSP